MDDDETSVIVVRSLTSAYSMRSKLSKDYVRSFIKQFDEGGLSPYRRSEPIPQYSGNEGVLQVVRSSSSTTVSHHNN